MTKYANLWNIVQQSMGFLILYIAFNSSENLESRVMSELGFGNLGFYNLAALQFSTMISALFATTVIRKFGIRVSHSIGTIGITLWILSSALPACKKYQTDPDIRDHSFIYSDGFIYFVNIMASIVCGIAATMIWTAQGVYCSSCSTEATSGFYFGLFWFFYMSSQIYGNLIAAFLLDSLSEEAFFYIMTLIAASSIIFFLLLRKPNIDTQSITETNQTSQISAALQKQTSPTFEYEEDSDNEVEEEEDRSVWQNAKQIINCMIQRKMRYVILQLAWTGISIAYYSGMLVLMMTIALEPTDPDTQDQYKKAELYMVIFGIGEMVGAFLQGYIVDRTSNKTGVISNLIFIAIQSIFNILFTITFQFDWVAAAMCFMWGAQDAATNNHTFGILGFEFDNNHDPFAVLCFIQGLSCFVFQMIQSFIPQTKEGFLYYTIGISIQGFVMNGTTYFFDYKQLKQNQNDKSSDSSKETDLLEEDNK